MAVATFRSELLYKAKDSEGAYKMSLTEGVQRAIDSVVEYPGSRKGEFGEWRLTDWIDWKLQQTLRGGGTERK
jgi:hypothetical protein